VISFFVYGVPAPAGSKRGFYNQKSKRVIVTDDSKRSRPWKALVSDAAIEAMRKAGETGCLEGPLMLSLTFIVLRPKGHYRTGKNAGLLRDAAPEYPTVKPDLLKLARAVEDALSGIVYRDDSQIVVENLYKLYGDRARVNVTVVPDYELEQFAEAAA
jgi:Holliday junction resolvase RusA-like endonuclease